MEIWKTIEGYGGRYSVSNKGNIRTNAYINTHAIYGTAKHKEKYRQPLTGARGYLRTVLTDENKKQHYIQIHRLVASAFIPNPLNLPQVNHKDGNKKNNCLENLEWCTNEQNREHAMKMGLIKKRDQLPHAKIKSEEIPKIQMMLRLGNSQKKVADFYGVNQQTISKIARKFNNQ